MSEKKNISTEEIFARAIQNHQQNKLQLANKPLGNQNKIKLKKIINLIKM